MIDAPIVATVTPFNSTGAVDLGALRDYLALLSSAGVTTILLNGTTGEFFSLTPSERRLVLECSRDYWPGTIITHIGSTVLGDAIELLDHALHYSDCLAAVTPYFIADPPEEGVYNFFRELLLQSSLPFLLYNFPRHTGASITPATVARLAAEFPLLVGVKDSGKDRGVTSAYKVARADMQVFVGDDSAAARVSELGVDGIVTGAGNPVVELPVRIADAVRSGDADAALRLQEAFDRWSAARRSSPVGEIAYVKAALAARLPGFPHQVRAPLVGASDAQRSEIRALLEPGLRYLAPEPEAASR